MWCCTGALGVQHHEVGDGECSGPHGGGGLLVHWVGWAGWYSVSKIILNVCPFPEENLFYSISKKIWAFIHIFFFFLLNCTSRVITVEKKIFSSVKFFSSKKIKNMYFKSYNILEFHSWWFRLWVDHSVVIEDQQWTDLTSIVQSDCLLLLYLVCFCLKPTHVFKEGKRDIVPCCTLL